MLLLLLLLILVVVVTGVEVGNDITVLEGEVKIEGS
jgi:hypothetical protein